MSIQPSSAGSVARLVDELRSPDALRRETAAARLAVIGPRAVTGLMRVSADARAPTAARVAALGALEAIADARSLPVCIELLAAGDEAVAAAAVSVLAAVAAGPGPRATAAFDALAALTLDRHATVSRRLAAVTALDGFPDRVLKPLYDALAKDPVSRVVARVTRRRSGVTASLGDLADGVLPVDPVLLSAIVRDEAADAAATVLRSLVDRVRQRERRAAEAERDAWRAVRGQLHQELGRRGSRLALADLRETLEALDRTLPVGFLAATAAVGDAACLVPIAAAWVASAGGNRWWRAHLAEAFEAIVRREGLARRHRVLTTILARWPSAGPLVATARR